MEKNKAEQVIKILTEALPFIQKFSKKICVVKYGGAAMVEKELKYSVARDIALMKQVGINVIVVHGGGPQIDNELSKVNIKRNFVDGIRVTDTKTIEVVSETLNNIVNKEIDTVLTWFWRRGNLTRIARPRIIPWNNPIPKADKTNSNENIGSWKISTRNEINAISIN